MNALAHNVMKCLEFHVGKDNAVTREELARRLFAPDRAIRDAIETLRREHPRGAQICSSSKIAGYWMMENFEEAKEVYRERRKHAIQMMVNARAQLRANERHFAGQDVLPDEELKQMELIC